MVEKMVVDNLPNPSGHPVDIIPKKFSSVLLDSPNSRVKEYFRRKDI